jgi:hypothetical protein
VKPPLSMVPPIDLLGIARKVAYYKYASTLISDLVTGWFHRRQGGNTLLSSQRQ